MTVEEFRQKIRLLSLEAGELSLRAKMTSVATYEWLSRQNLRRELWHMGMEPVYSFRRMRNRVTNFLEAREVEALSKVWDLGWQMPNYQPREKYTNSEGRTMYRPARMKPAQVKASLSTDIPVVGHIIPEASPNQAAAVQELIDLLNADSGIVDETDDKPSS